MNYLSFLDLWFEYDVPEVIVELLEGDLVVHTLGLHHLDLLQHVVGLLHNGVCC